MKVGGGQALKQSEVHLQPVLDVAKRNFSSTDPETGLDDIARESGTWIAELQDIVIESKCPESVLEVAALELLDVGTRAE